MAENVASNKLENEKEIVEKAKTDDQAFSILYYHYFPKIYGYLFRRTGSHEVTEDLVSETFIKVFSSLENYKYQGYSFGAWLFRIATNNLIDYYRKTSKTKEVDIEKIAEPSDDNQDPNQLVQDKQDRQKVNEVMKMLPERYQEVLYLKFFAEFSTAEIANSLNITPNNGRVLVYRALKSFDIEYKKYGK